MGFVIAIGQSHRSCYGHCGGTILTLALTSQHRAESESLLPGGSPGLDSPVSQKLEALDFKGLAVWSAGSLWTLSG